MNIVNEESQTNLLESIGHEKDSVMSGSVHIGQIRNADKNDTKQKEDLEWQLNHEKKLAKSMIDMLEKKVSKLLAEVNRLETTAEEEYQNRKNFDLEVEKL